MARPGAHPPRVVRRIASRRGPRKAWTLALAAMWGAAWAFGAEPSPGHPSLQPPRSALEPPAERVEAPASDDPLASLRTGLEEVERIERWIEWMSADGSDLSVLFGVPAEADRAAVRLGSEAVLRLAQSATRRLEAGIAGFDRAESKGERAGADASELASRAVHARTVLLPLRAARAMVLSAAAEGDDERRAKLGSAAVRVAAGAEPVSPWADAERSLLMGLGRLVTSPAGMEGDEAARAALEHFSASKKTATDPDSPPALQSEVGDEIALGTVLAASRVRDQSGNAPNVPGGVDALRLLDRVLEQPGVSGSVTARLAAAELRLRLIGGGVINAGTPEAALEGFVREFDRALSEGRDAARVLDRLTVVARERADTDAPLARSGGAGAGPRLPDALAAVGAARSEPTLGRIEEASRLVAALPPAGPWRRVLALALAQTEPPVSAQEACLALARAVTDLAADMPGIDDQRLLLARARGALWPFGPDADLDLSERVMTLSHEIGAAPGGSLRVVSGSTAWGLKEVHEARADRAIAERSYDAAFGRLERSDALASEVAGGAARCVACWWRLMDAMLRDADAAEHRGELIRRVVDRTQAALAGTAHERVPRAVATDVLLYRGQFERAAEVVGGADADDGHDGSPGAEVLLAAARAGDPGSAARLISALQRMDPSSSAQWWLRVIDRAWASVRRATRGFISTDAAHPEPVRHGAAALSALSDGAEQAAPSSARGTILERCAWGLLIGGRAAEAAMMFEKAAQSAGRRVGLMIGKGEALLMAGDDPSAFGVFRDVASGTEPRGEHARDHFHAWARMLEILARQNADGSKTDRIRRESRRLMLLNPAAACPECAARIEAAAR